jgi:hypothetical protein
MSITISGSSVTFSDSGQSMATAADAYPHRNNTLPAPVGSIGVFFTTYQSYLALNSTISGSYLFKPYYNGAKYSTLSRGKLFAQGSDAGGGIVGDPSYPRTVLFQGFSNPTAAFGQDNPGVSFFRGPGGYIEFLSGTWKALVGVPRAYIYNAGGTTSTCFYPVGMYLRVA